MPSIQQTSFTTPGYDYGVDVGQIERRRALAQALQQQGMSSLPTPQTPAGGFTPRVSPFEGLSRIAQIYASKRQEGKADTQQKALNARIQSDYQQMLAKGLGQLQGTHGSPAPADELGGGPGMPAQAPNPMAALQTFGSHPMGAQFVPLAMQEMQRQRLAEALRGGSQQPQPSPMNPGGPNPSVMAGSGQMPLQQPQTPMGSQLGGPAGGVPMEAWLQADPTGKSYLQHFAEGNKTAGRVFYDQNNKAYTVNAQGQPQYLQGISQGISPADQYKIGNELTNTYFNTGMTPQPIGNPGASGMQPAMRPQPSGQPALQPVPGQRPPQANPKARLTPKQQQELEAQRPDAVKSVNAALNTIQNSLNEADRLSRSPGLSHITGPIAGRTPNLTGTATNAQANLDTLKAQIGVDVLNAMREASKTGGAVGQVTEKEWPILQNQLGALQQAQTTDVFKMNLEAVKSTLKRMQENTRKAHESRFGALDWNPQIPGSTIQPSQNDPLGLR